MSKAIDESNVYQKLRKKAEEQVRSGTTATAGQWSMGVDALQLLHRLSSNPDHAQDALKLLHELQVHQVELDLQNEEIAANEQALEEELGFYRALYDYAPIGYCVVDFQGLIIQGNLVAAELLGAASEGMDGQGIDTLLTPESQPVLLDLLQRVVGSDKKESCVAETAGGEPGSQPLKFFASTSPEREHILLICCKCENAE